MGISQDRHSWWMGFKSSQSQVVSQAGVKSELSGIRSKSSWTQVGQKQVRVKLIWSQVKSSQSGHGQVSHVRQVAIARVNTKSTHVKVNSNPSWSQLHPSCSRATTKLSVFTLFMHPSGVLCYGAVCLLIWRHPYLKKFHSYQLGTWNIAFPQAP